VGTLLAYTYFPPVYLKPYIPALEENTITYSQPVTETPKENPPASHYQGVYISREGLTGFLSYEFAKYGIEDQYEKAVAVLNCESSWLIDVYSKNQLSYGIAQFTPATWKDFGIGDYKNPYDQIKTLSKMWSLGLQSRWDCYTILGY